jgi:hypothetical protein
MLISEPGHIYQLHQLDLKSDDPLTQNLTFVNREPGTEHGGTQTQEVLRALIDRTMHCDNCLRWEGNDEIIYHLRMALVLHEARALIRKTEKGYIAPEQITTSVSDGHFRLTPENRSKDAEKYANERYLCSPAQRLPVAVEQSERAAEILKSPGAARPVPAPIAVNLTDQAAEAAYNQWRDALSKQHLSPSWSLLVESEDPEKRKVVEAWRCLANHLLIFWRDKIRIQEEKDIAKSFKESVNVHGKDFNKARNLAENLVGILADPDPSSLSWRGSYEECVLGLLNLYL